MDSNIEGMVSFFDIPKVVPKSEMGKSLIGIKLNDTPKVFDLEVNIETKRRPKFVKEGTSIDIKVGGSKFSRGGFSSPSISTGKPFHRIWLEKQKSAA